MCRISGRVQGVMYRDFALRRARKLNLAGCVQNEPDGAVRVVAEGEEEKLRELLEQLRRGSFFSKIECVEEQWGEATGEFSNFLIR